MVRHLLPSSIRQLRFHSPHSQQNASVDADSRNTDPAALDTSQKNSHHGSGNRTTRHCHTADKHKASLLSDPVKAVSSIRRSLSLLHGEASRAPNSGTLQRSSKARTNSSPHTSGRLPSRLRSSAATYCQTQNTSAFASPFASASTLSAGDCFSQHSYFAFAATRRTI